MHFVQSLGRHRFGGHAGSMSVILMDALDLVTAQAPFQRKGIPPMAASEG